MAPRTAAQLSQFLGITRYKKIIYTIKSRVEHCIIIFQSLTRYMYYNNGACLALYAVMSHPVMSLLVYYRNNVPELARDIVQLYPELASPLIRTSI